jgi:hypothetical protein
MSHRVRERLHAQILNPAPTSDVVRGGRPVTPWLLIPRQLRNTERPCQRRGRGLEHVAGSTGAPAGLGIPHAHAGPRRR